MTETQPTETAKYSGILHLPGGIDIPCGVMEDGTRLLSERKVTAALGGKRGGSHWRRQKEEGTKLPVFISANNLVPYISEPLKSKLVNHKRWRQVGMGGTGALGIDATALPEICNVYLEARRDNNLVQSQEHIAFQAEILMSALAKVGIVALVDEATGYQEERQRTELQQLLSKYIAEELQPWTKRFPDTFYKEMFRLRGWDYDNLGAGGKKPRLVGKLTNEIVYARFPDGVLEELKKKNPPKSNGNRRFKHHQFLTQDIGDVHLNNQIIADITLMKASKTWPGFITLLDRAYPKPGSQQGELDLDIE